MRVADWMTPDPITVPTTLSADGATALLSYYRIHHLPVVDENGRAIGMLSDRDVVTAAAGNRSRFATSRQDLHRVADMMSTPVVTVAPPEPLRQAVRQMLSAHVHALVVVDGEDRPVGLLTSTDCLAAELSTLPPDTSEADDLDNAPAPAGTDAS